MATSMTLGRVFVTKTKNSLPKLSWRHFASSAHYVLLPEIPPDTPDNNAAMRCMEQPQFNEITPEKIITGCAKLAIEYEVELGKHVASLDNAEAEPSFDSVFLPLEKVSFALNTAWRNAKNLNYLRSADGYRVAFQRVHPQVERARNERWVSEPLYKAVKVLSQQRANLDQYQERLVDMYLLESKLNGMALSDVEKKKFMSILEKLIEQKNHFRNRTMLSHNLFSHVVTDFGQVASMPKSVLMQIAADKFDFSRGPWKITLNQNVYNSFMEHCDNRMSRWNVWFAYNNRASIEQDDLNLSNHMIIKEIRQYRKDLAICLGFENFAEMSMETKMAGNVENVLNMIENLKNKFRNKAEEEMISLQEFASSNGFNSTLEMWDVSYWRRKHRESKFGIEVDDVAEYFPLPHVLKEVFSMCKTLFGIDIQECTNEVVTWNEDVKFFKIFNEADGEFIASFYMDPYARPHQKIGGSWMEPGRERCDIVGSTPYSYLNLNLAPPFGPTPSLLSLDDLYALLYEVGHGLQQLLTTVPYSELAGQRNVEWDALQTCALLLPMFALNEATLSKFSSHIDTGAPLSRDMAKSILDCRDHLSSFDMMKQLYYSALDMEMYINDDHWVQTMKNVWKEFMPLPLHEDDNHPCAMTSIFCDQYPAAYYSVKWSEMLAADIFKSFEEVGLENTEKLGLVGRRFRETFLSQGGGVPTSEIFRQFKGRDPSQDALIQRYGINL